MIDIEKLISQGQDSLDSYDYKKAKQIGKKLLSARHSSGFEILAKAYYEDNQLQKAIQTLKEGCQRAPAVPILWLLLGNYLSDNNEFEKAFEAFQNGLKLPNSDVSALHLNYAIALERAEKYPEALNQIQQIPPNHNLIENLHKDRIYASLQNKVGNYSEAISLSERAISIYSEIDEKELLSDFYIEKGFSILKKLDDRGAALEIIKSAIRLDRHNKRAMWAFREILNQVSQKAKYFRIMIKAEWPEPIKFEKVLEDANYFTSFDVVADDMNEALEFIKLFEPENIHNTIRINESEVLDGNHKQPKGVYKAIGYMFYPRRDDKKKNKKEDARTRK